MLEYEACFYKNRHRCESLPLGGLSRSLSSSTRNGNALLTSVFRGSHENSQGAAALLFIRKVSIIDVEIACPWIVVGAAITVVPYVLFRQRMLFTS